MKIDNTVNQQEENDQTGNCYCICNKPNGKIICKICGYMTYGRVRKTCHEHPMTIFLMDIDQCPRCKAFSKMLVQITDAQTDKK